MRAAGECPWLVPKIPSRFLIYNLLGFAGCWTNGSRGAKTAHSCPCRPARNVKLQMPRQLIVKVLVAQRTLGAVQPPMILAMVIWQQVVGLELAPRYA